MTVRTCFAGLVNLVAVVACAAVAVGVVLAVNWVMDNAWPQIGPHARLVFGLVAPLGVVLFALLVEQGGKVAERIVPRAV